MKRPHPGNEGLLPKSGTKVYYWPATGKAQTIRLLLADANVEWEDVVFETEMAVYSSQDSLPTIARTDAYRKFCDACREKGGNSTTNTPMLELDGKFYTQSHAIYKLVARKSGLYPAGADEAYVVDNILAHVEDARWPCYNALIGKVDKETFLGTLLPNHLGNLERLLGGSDFFVPGTFSLADILVFDLLHNFYLAQVPGACEKYPNLKRLYKSVGERQHIKAYLESDKCKKINKFVKLE
uniref:GST C-terminal domain-containing protein n=1 Tax=Zooxanthella nutricula TaxID=1333877 RepID=A0A7S2NUZ5_9DINO